MNATLTAHDEMITAKQDEMAAHRATLTAARALREQIQEERHKASGRLTAGDATATPDLDALLDRLVDARHAEQDALTALTTAQAAIRPLEQARAVAATAEVVGHLRVLVETVRPAAAALVSARLDALAEAIRTYLAVVDDSVALFDLAPQPGGTLRPREMHAMVARCVARRLTPILSRNGPVVWSTAHHDDPLPESDAAATRALRSVLPATLAEPAAGR
jgi:hypothetical protein